MTQSNNPNKESWEEKERFFLGEAFKRIEEYADKQHKSYYDTKKVFYHLHEWSGWRFYLKALRYGDWKSIIRHIKNSVSNEETK